MGIRSIEAKRQGVELIVSSHLLGKEPVKTNSVAVVDGVAHFESNGFEYAVSAPFVVIERRMKVEK